VRRIPKHVREFYTVDKISFSLKTTCDAVASRRAQRLTNLLDEQWFAMGIQQDVTFGRYLVKNALSPASPSAAQTPHKDDPAILLSNAAECYGRLRGELKGATFHQGITRSIGYLLSVSGDKAITDYERRDANQLRDHLLEKGLAGPSIARTLGIIRAIFNFTISEHALKMDNPFQRVQFDRTRGSKIRETIPKEIISLVQSFCYQEDDEARWLIALISDTGMRLGEAAGLLLTDLVLSHEYPHVIVQTHAWRSLKTRSSARTVPLIGSSLWAAQRILEEHGKSKFAFPRYNEGRDLTATNSASAALNKWLKKRTSSTYTIHGFRHSMRDRLRSIECPSEIIDQLGGWHTEGVGSQYGNGYSLINTHRWMSGIMIT